MPIVLGGVIGLVAVTAVTVHLVAANAAGCSGGIPLNVSATPEIAPAMQEIATRWEKTRPAVGNHCISVSITKVPAADVAANITAYAGGAIDVAAKAPPTPSEGQLPAVWIPDSTAWLTRVARVDRTIFDGEASPVVFSPVVIAMPVAIAKSMDWPAQRLKIASIKSLVAPGSRLKFGIAEPRRETASLAGVMLFNDALAGSDADLPGLVKTLRAMPRKPDTQSLLRSFGPDLNAAPAAEQAVLAYNATNPSVKLAAVQLDPASPVLDYPYAIRSGLPRSVHQAALLFQAAVTDREAQVVLARSGFRKVDGEVGAGFPASADTTADPAIGSPITEPDKLEQAIGLWTAANSPSRTIAIFDLSSSMQTPMSTAHGPMSRAQVMAEAAQQGLALFTSDSKVGMWTFNSSHHEVLPIAELDARHLAEFDQKAASLRPGQSNQAALYDTMLAAYKEMKDGYEPGRPNIIVVLTDGGDSNPGGARLDQFRISLQRLADTTKPIRVVLIGIGADSSGAADLTEIAKATGGGYFPLTSPEQIQTIFLKALLKVGAA